MFKDGHVISGTLSGLIERLVPLPNYYPDVSSIFNSVDIIVYSNECITNIQSRMSGSKLISKFKSGRDSSNPTVSLVPEAGGLLRSCLQTRAEFFWRLYGGFPVSRNLYLRRAKSRAQICRYRTAIYCASR